MRRLWLWIPLALFAGLSAIFVSRLHTPTNNSIASQWVGHPMPTFDLPAAASSRPGLASVDLSRGKPKLVNIFASWCIPCASEAHVLEIIKQKGVDVEGIALRDTRADLDGFLARNGNPYSQIGGDVSSNVAIALGSTGVPESYVVDGKGIIRKQYIGALSEGDVSRVLADLSAAQ